MLKLALRNVFRSKFRSFLLIIGITFTIALETGIIVTVDTIYEDFYFDNRNQNYTDISVNPKDWVKLSDLRELVETIKTVSGVQRASEALYVSTEIIQNETGTTPNIIIYGVNFQKHTDIRILNMTEGSSNIIDKSTVLISQSVKDFLGNSLGEILTLEEKPDIGFKGINNLIVGGIFSEPAFFGNKEGFSFILVDIETLLSLFEENYHSTSLNSEIDVTVNNLIEVKSVAESIQDKIGPEFYVFAEKNISDLQALGINAYSVAMNLVILASLLVEFLFINNILTISVRERSKEYGILRTVGISSKQLVIVILIEVLIYSMMGGILGILLGIGFSDFLVTLVDQFYTSLEFQTIHVDPSSLITIFVSGLTVALLSALFPLLLVLKVPVVQNIHSRTRVAKNSKNFGFWKYAVILGIIFAITGYVLSFFVGPAQFLQFSLFSWHFAIIILIFLGTLLIETGLLIFLPRIGEKTLFVFNIVSRQISMKNLTREFQRALFTVLTSSVALTFIIFVGIVSSAVIASVPQFYENQWGNIDLVTEATDPGTPINFTETLLANERIRSVAYIQELRTEIGNTHGYVYGIEPLQYASFAETVFDSISDQPEYLLLSDNNTMVINCLVSDNLYQALDNVSLGSSVSVKTTTNETVDVRIVAIIKGNAFLGNGKYIYIDSKHFQEVFKSELAKLFICDVIEEYSIYDAQLNLTLSYPNVLKDVIGIDHFRKVIENSLIFQANLFQILFIESFILAGIAQFVGILISTLQMEREMGIMRSMGLSKWGVLNIFITESSALGLASLIFGFINGIFGAILLLWYISQSIPIDLWFPLDHIILWLIISLILTVTSTIIPAYRSSQKEVVATISARPMRPVTEQMLKNWEILPYKINTEKYLIPWYVRIAGKFLIVIYYIFFILLAYIFIRGIFFAGSIA